MIKCEEFQCQYYNKRKKQGCERQTDPHTCKGYLLTIINVQQMEIQNKDSEISKLKGMIDNGLGWEDMINDI